MLVGSIIIFELRGGGDTPREYAATWVEFASSTCKHRGQQVATTHHGPAAAVKVQVELAKGHLDIWKRQPWSRSACSKV